MRLAGFAARLSADMRAHLVERFAQAIVVILPLLGTLERLRPPLGEKFLFAHQEGSADLWLPFYGALAMLQDIDPYGPMPPEWQEPTGWGLSYPPSMLVMYVPLVWISHSDLDLARQIFFFINIAVLAVFTYVVWRLGRSLAGSTGYRGQSLLFTLIPVTLSVQTAFVLERGQSEIINAALLWGGVLLFIRGKQAAAIAAVTVAAAIKGYSAPIVLGFIAAARNKKSFFQGVASAAAVTLLLALPVWRHWRHGIEAMLSRPDSFFHSDWYNHSFKNTFFTVAPSLSDAARDAVLIAAAVVALGSLLRLIIATRRGDMAERAWYAVVFVTAAETLVIGLPAFAGPYSFVLVLPGLLLIGIRFVDLRSSFGFGVRFSLGLGFAVIIALLLVLRKRWFESPVPLDGWGLVVLVVVLAAMTAAGGRSWQPAFARGPTESPPKES